jgi:C-terminal processing protease CtpA/Prc
VGRVLYFGSSITVADVLMNDGKSLERVGVTPDETLLPTGADLAARRDPVLARAAGLAGVQLDPEKAGTLFPVDWKK